MSTKELIMQATEILKGSGCGWDGRPAPKNGASQDRFRQYQFERRMVKCGFRHSSRRAR